MSWSFREEDGLWIPKLIIGDVREVITKLPDNFVDCVITSPPYWRQRDYGHEKQIGRELTPEEYVGEIARVFRELRNKLRRTATVFLNIGYKYWKEELVLIPEMVALAMRDAGYALKNKVIWYKPNAMPTSARNRLNNVYEPVMIFVRKDAKEVYYFNVDDVAEAQRTLRSYLKLKDLKPTDLLGVSITDPITFRGLREGLVTGLRYSGSKVIEVLASWNEGDEEYVEFGDVLKSYPESVNFKCPKCGYEMSYWEIILSFANSDAMICSCCRELLCKSEEDFPIPVFRIDSSHQEVYEIRVGVITRRDRLTEVPRNSKFRRASLSTGSPAGRLAVVGEKLTVKRKWRVPQPLICEYLRYWRERRILSIEDIDCALGYRYTAGHWFRRDFNWWGRGGSLPRPSDWLKLKRILGFDNIYDKLLTERVAVLVTVKPHERGRNPGDVWRIELEQYPEEHFAVFPRKLVERCLLLGCPPGGVVLDPFAGSGTVGEVAMKLGRKAVLIELVPHYAELIRRRCDGKVELIHL